jgi:hypothetical protein
MAVAEIMRSLYGAILQDASGVCAYHHLKCSLTHYSMDTLQGQHDVAREDLRGLLGYMTTYFPFRPNTITNRDIKVYFIILACGSGILTLMFAS